MKYTTACLYNIALVSCLCACYNGYDSGRNFNHSSRNCETTVSLIKPKHEYGISIDTIYADNYYVPFYMYDTASLYVLYNNVYMIKNFRSTMVLNLKEFRRAPIIDLYVNKNYIAFNIGQEPSGDSSMIFSITEKRKIVSLKNCMVEDITGFDEIFLMYASSNSASQPFTNFFYNCLTGKKLLFTDSLSVPTVDQDNYYFAKWSSQRNSNSRNVEVLRYSLIDTAFEKHQLSNFTGSLLYMFGDNYLCLNNDETVQLRDVRGSIIESYKLPEAFFYRKYFKIKTGIVFYGWLDTDKKRDKYYFIKCIINFKKLGDPDGK